MKIINIFLAIILSMATFAYSMPANFVPKKINYQGKIQIDGSDYTGSKIFVFRIYDDLTGGTLNWTSDSTALDITNGVFSAILSNGNPTLSASVFREPRWLEIEVGGVTLTPREEIVASPYAMVAAAVAEDIDLPAGRLTGNLPAIDGSALSGYTMGNHIATTTLQMGSYGINTSSNINANAFYGDGSNLTNMSGFSGDNLGDHTATQALQMGAYGVNTSSDISAASYQINGQAVLRVYNSEVGSLVAVGFGAGANSMNGLNTFVGHQAGYFNTGGARNSFVGHWAGYSNIDGTDNSFLGREAGYSNTSGGNNSFLGHHAGYSNTTASYNSFIGDNAGYGNTSGNNNSFLGHHAGYNNTTASYNSFVGGQAGFQHHHGEL